MNRKKLESYQANKRLIERNHKKIEEEQCKDFSEVKGKVTGSSRNFPYIENHMTVRMSDPIEVDRANKRILKWRQEIAKAEKEIEEVEMYISDIEDVRDREIFTYRYIDNMKAVAIAKKVGYTKGRISQIISKYLKD